MNSYIVRVYSHRENQNDQADRLYGVVETAENGEISVFRSFDELWTILSSAESVQHGIVGEKSWEDQNEKRRDHRFSYRCPIKYRTRKGSTGPSTSDESTGRLFDISRGGMRMQANGKKLKKGDVLKIQVPISETPVAFPSLTKVSWVQKEQSGNCQVGLQFVE